MLSQFILFLLLPPSVPILCITNTYLTA